MEYYREDDRRKLTNYDLFRLNNQDMTPVYHSSSNVKQQERTADYESYLLGELGKPYRSKPILKEHEYSKRFCASERREWEERAKNDYIPDYGYAEKREKKPSAFKQMMGKVEFRKGGKILLALYVIFAVALAFILIMTNTPGDQNLEPASASDSIKAEQSVGIRPMTIEDEEEESENWFDALCDSLNR